MNMSHEELLVPGQRTPLLIQAGEPHRLSDYISRSREAIGEKLLRHGALLFRGFAVADSADFAEAVQALDIPLLDYRYRSTPRTGKGRGVYTATEYPADREIPLHNENAYQRQWPRKLAFCCITPAAVGGATPIADMREVRRRLDPAIFEKFARLGVRYDRVFHNMIDLSWQDAFQTDDPDEVARYCASQGIDHEWLDEDTLHTSQVCPGVMRHPQLDEDFLFNQAHLFHPSALSEELLQHLLDAFGEDMLPRNARYGNGEPIEAQTLQALRAAYADSAVDLPWQAGDVALIDNVQAAHGRRSYQGERLVLTSLLEPHVQTVTSEASLERVA